MWMQDRVVLVTGASRGIGRAIAIQLATDGYDIVGNATTYDPGNRERGLAETELRVEEKGGAFLPAPGDVSDLALHDDWLSASTGRFGRVDLLVNNAGVGKRVDLLETTPENFDRVIGVNLRAAFFLTQCFARHMVEQARQGQSTRPAIVFITSISVDTSSPTRAE